MELGGGGGQVVDSGGWKWRWQRKRRRAQSARRFALVYNAVQRISLFIHGHRAEALLPLSEFLHRTNTNTSVLQNLSRVS